MVVGVVRGKTSDATSGVRVMTSAWWEWLGEWMLANALDANLLFIVQGKGPGRG